MDSQAIAILTHRMDAAVVDHYQALKACEERFGSVRVMWHVNDRPEPAPNGIAEQDLLRFTGADIVGLGLRLLGAGLIPGCQHYPLYRFFLDGFPQADYVWMIEHDVRFAGDWHELFTYFDDCRDDLLCAHLLDHGCCPDWYWWPLAYRGEGPVTVIKAARRLRAFLPVMRLSRPAIAALYQWQRQGWRGHSEVLIPTLLHHYGYRIRDIGGDGPHVRDSERNRFYLGTVTGDGGARFDSTMRFRPVFEHWGQVPGKLYHPVKATA